MAVSSSNGGLGLPTGDLVRTAVCGTTGVGSGKDSPEEPWGDGDNGESEAAVSGI